MSRKLQDTNNLNRNLFNQDVITVEDLTVNDNITFTGGNKGDILYLNSSGQTVKLPIGPAGDVLNVSPSGIPEWDPPGTATVPDPLTLNQLNVTNLRGNPGSTPVFFGDGTNTDQEIIEFNKGGGNYLIRYDDNLDLSGGAGIIFTSTQPVSTQYCFTGSHASPGATQLRIDNNSALNNGLSVWAQGLYPTPLSVANSRRITSTVNGSTNTWALDVAQHINGVQNFITGTFDSSPSQLSSFESFSIGSAGINTGVDVNIGSATNKLNAVGGIKTPTLDGSPSGGGILINDNTTVNSKALTYSGGSTLSVSSATSVLDATPTTKGFSWYFNNSNLKQVLELGTARDILQVNPAGNAPEWTDSIALDTIETNNITSKPTGGIITIPDTVLMTDGLAVEGSILSLGGLNPRLSFNASTLFTDQGFSGTAIQGGLWYFDGSTGNGVRLKFDSVPGGNYLLGANAGRTALEFKNQIVIDKATLSSGAVIGASGDPAGAVDGQLYYNTTTEMLRVYDGTSWNDIDATVPDPLSISTLRVSTIESNPPGGSISVEDIINITSTDMNINTSDVLFNSTSSLTLSSGTSLTDNTSTTNGFTWYFNSSGVKQELEHGAGNSIMAMSALGVSPNWISDIVIDSVTSNTLSVDVIDGRTGTTVDIASGAGEKINTATIDVTNSLRVGTVVPICCLGMAGNATATTFTAINTFRTIAGTMSLIGVANKFTDAANVITYTGTQNAVLMLTWHVRYTGDDNAGMQFALFKNGSVTASPRLRSWNDDLNSTGEGGSMAVVDLASTNDTYEIRVQAVTNTNSMTVTDFSLMVQGFEEP